MERYNPLVLNHVVQVGRAGGRIVWAVRVDLDGRDNDAAVDWLIRNAYAQRVGVECDNGRKVDGWVVDPSRL